MIGKVKETARLAIESSAFDGRVLLGLDRLGLVPVSQRHERRGSRAGVWLIGCEPERGQDFGCWRVELVAAMPRVECPECGVVAAVPWAEPGSRFTRDFEAECAWLMTVANQKTVSGFLHVAWRTVGDIAHRVAGRLKAAMPSSTSIGVDETSYRKGHTYITVVVDHERRRVIWAHDGYGRDVFDLFFPTVFSSNMRAGMPAYMHGYTVTTATGSLIRSVLPGTNGSHLFSPESRRRSAG